MTIERAIELLQTGSKFPEVFHTTEEVDEVCQMAIAALDAQKNLEPYAEADQKGRLYILPPEHSVAQCLDLAKQVTDMGLTMQQALDIFRAQQEQPNEPLTGSLKIGDFVHGMKIIGLDALAGTITLSGWKPFRHKPEQEERKMDIQEAILFFKTLERDRPILHRFCALSINALQEQAKREQGCEYCDFSSGSCGGIFEGEDDFFLITSNNSHEFYIATNGKGVFREAKIKFCPMCGRKLGKLD